MDTEEKKGGKKKASALNRIVAFRRVNKRVCSNCMLGQSEATLACSVLCRSLPPFLSVLFSPSPLVIVVLQKAGGGVFTKKEVRPIGGQEHLCAVSQKPLTVLHVRQPRSHSSSLALSRFLPAACLHECSFFPLFWLALLLFSSLCSSVLHRLSFLLLRDMHF